MEMDIDVPIRLAKDFYKTEWHVEAICYESSFYTELGNPIAVKEEKAAIDESGRTRQIIEESSYALHKESAKVANESRNAPCSEPTKDAGGSENALHRKSARDAGGSGNALHEAPAKDAGGSKNALHRKSARDAVGSGNALHEAPTKDARGSGNALHNESSIDTNGKREASFKQYDPFNYTETREVAKEDGLTTSNGIKDGNFCMIVHKNTNLKNTAQHTKESLHRKEKPLDHSLQLKSRNPKVHSSPNNNNNCVGHNHFINEEEVLKNLVLKEAYSENPKGDQDVNIDQQIQTTLSKSKILDRYFMTMKKFVEERQQEIKKKYMLAATTYTRRTGGGTIGLIPEKAKTDLHEQKNQKRGLMQIQSMYREVVSLLKRENTERIDMAKRNEEMSLQIKRQSVALKRVEKVIKHSPGSIHLTIDGCDTTHILNTIEVRVELSLRGNRHDREIRSFHLDDESIVTYENMQHADEYHFTNGADPNNLRKQETQQKQSQIEEANHDHREQKIPDGVDANLKYAYRKGNVRNDYSDGSFTSSFVRVSMSKTNDITKQCFGDSVQKFEASVSCGGDDDDVVDLDVVNANEIGSRKEIKVVDGWTIDDDAWSHELGRRLIVNGVKDAEYRNCVLGGSDGCNLDIRSINVVDEYVAGKHVYLKKDLQQKRRTVVEECNQESDDVMDFQCQNMNLGEHAKMISHCKAPHLIISLFFQLQTNYYFLKIFGAHIQDLTLIMIY